MDAIWLACKTYFVQVIEICIPNANVNLKVKKNVASLDDDKEIAITIVIKDTMDAAGWVYSGLSINGSLPNNGHCYICTNRYLHIMFNTVAAPE